MDNTLREMTAFCDGCRMICNKNGIWGLPVRFLHAFWEENLGHGLCPDCTEQRQSEPAAQKPGCREIAR